MNRINLILLLLCLYGLAAAQEKGAISINPSKEKTADLTNNIYEYPAFADGKVLFKDNVVVTAKMNYHRVFGQILFITDKKDTMALANPATFAYVTIASDTFYYCDEGYARKISHYAAKNLVVKQTLKYIGREKEGPYGSYSQTSSADAAATYSPDDQITQKIETNTNYLYKYNNSFYLSDDYNNFFKATKKNFFNLFSRHSAKMKEYLDAHHVNYNDREDLEKFLEFIQELK